MALNYNEEVLYIFSSLGIWKVYTKTILSNVINAGSLSGFSSQKVGGVDKVLHAESGVFVALKRLERIWIIP